jgi:hypothetical protein
MTKGVTQNRSIEALKCLVSARHREKTPGIGRAFLDKFLGSSDRVQGLPMTSNRLHHRCHSHHFGSQAGIEGPGEATGRRPPKRCFVPSLPAMGGAREIFKSHAARSQRCPAPPLEKGDPFRLVGGVARSILERGPSLVHGGDRASDVARRTAACGGSKRRAGRFAASTRE